MAKKIPREEIDDTDHLTLYKCPGPHQGSGSRTFDIAHAESEEEVTELEADGWSQTLPEAYKAGGFKAIKEPEKPTPKGTAKKPAAKGPTLDEVKAALGKLNSKNSQAASALLKRFAAASAPDLKETQYADFLKATEDALKG